MSADFCGHSRLIFGGRSRPLSAPYSRPCRQQAGPTYERVAVVVSGRHKKLAADPFFVPGARRRDPESVADWASEFSGHVAIVIDKTGQQVGEGVAAWLRHAGAASADVLTGGSRDLGHFRARLSLDFPRRALHRKSPRQQGSFRRIGVDFWSLALSFAAAIAIFMFRVGMLPTVAGSCVAGMALFLAGAI